MVNLDSIMDFKNVANEAASSAQEGQGNNPQAAVAAAPSLGGESETNSPTPAAATAPQLGAPSAAVSQSADIKEPENKEAPKEAIPVPTTAVAPPRLDAGPNDTSNREESVMPDKLKPVGEKPKTIIDEDYKTARQRGFVTGQQWLTENAKAAQRGERDPLTMDEIMEVYRDESLDETLEEKEKRERREELSQTFSTLGDITANAANFAFATQGGIPGDYNNRAATEREKEIRDRRQALKEKYDNIIMQAKGDEIAYARDLSAAREKQASIKEIKDSELAFKREEAKRKAEVDAQKTAEDNARKAAQDAETKRKNDAQIKKWESDAKAGSQRANAYSTSVNNKKSGSGSGKKDEKYAAAFIGKNGTYRFKDSDIAPAVASRAISMIRDIAAERKDEDVLNAIRDAMANPSSSSAAMEFLRQRMGAYPSVEDYVAKEHAKFHPDTSKDKEYYTKYNNEGANEDYSSFKRGK